MNYGVILAGGTGARMRSATMPKQFLTIGGKSLLSLTVEKFFACQHIDKVVVTAPRSWLEHTKGVLNGAGYPKLDICLGGASRQESLYNALKYIEKTYGLNDNDIAVSHDAARPFVTMRILEENVELCREHGATDTVMPATDTIVTSEDGVWLHSIPPRSRMFQGQTPQSFFIRPFLRIYERLDQSYLEQMTDAARILREQGLPVALVRGEPFNIKITTDYDLGLANYILSGVKL